jgi:hypothetical protein
MSEGHLHLPALPEHVRRYPAWAKAKQTAIRAVAARTRAQSNQDIAREVSAVTGSFTSRAQVEDTLLLYADFPWSKKFERTQMDLAHPQAAIGIMLETLS